MFTRTCEETRNMTDSFVKSDSGDFALNESCIRSDIENIIKKMYNPVTKVSNDLIRDDNYQDFLYSNKHAVNKDSSHTFYSRPTTGSDSNETTNKRFGFYFESIGRRNVRTTVMESSTSDSVSVPNTKRRLQRSRVVCNCCRRKISEFHHGRIKYCKICKGPKTSHLEHSSKQLQVEGEKSCEGKGQGDTHLDEDRKLSRLSVCVHKENKSSLQPVHDGNLSHIPVSRVSSTSVDKSCSKLRDSELEHLQVVPDLEKGVVEGIFSEECSKLKQPNDLKANSKTRSTTVFGRVFSTFSIYFSKSKLPNQVDSKSKVNKLNKVSEEYDIQKQSNLAALKIKSQKSSPDLIEVSRKEYEVLTRSIENIGSHSENGNEDAVCKSNDSQISARINVEPKLSYYNIKSQDKIAHKAVTSKSSSMYVSKTNPHQELFEDTHKSYHTIVLDKSKISRETLASKNTHEPNRMSDVSEESIIESNQDSKFGKTKLVENEDHCIAEVISKNNSRAAEFWVKTFGSCQLVFAFLTSFIHELLKLTLRSLLCPLLWGTVQVWSDHFFKPCLTVLFKGIIEPVFGFLEEVAKSSRNMCLPFSECLGHFLHQIASLCGTCRLVEVHKTYNQLKDSRNPE